MSRKKSECYSNHILNTEAKWIPWCFILKEREERGRQRKKREGGLQNWRKYFSFTRSQEEKTIPSSSKGAAQRNSKHHVLLSLFPNDRAVRRDVKLWIYEQT